MAELTKVQVGDLAPDFAWEDDQGSGTLASLTKRSVVILFFYPKDFTPGCTTQACSYRDEYTEFLRLGAEIVGISGDSAESHQAFVERHRLPYRLVSDRDGSIRRRYGVPKTWGLIPGRVSILIDRLGIVRQIHSSQFRPASHVRAMQTALRQLQQDRS